jgi:hypothetical protein
VVVPQIIDRVPTPPPRYFFLEKPSVIFSKSLKNLFLVTAAILDRQDHYNPIRVDLDK